MATLVIQTQYRENYAFPNEGYEHGVSEPYWKFKGGSTYFVDNLTSEQINKIAPRRNPTLTKLIEYSNEASEEYILDWEIRDLGKNGDGKGPNLRTWECPNTVHYEDKQWKCPSHSRS